MSKNITIQESGTPRNLNSISEIETAKQGGGSVSWVSEEERRLITKTITKKGTYKASSDGAYGYSKVIVKLPKSSSAEKDKKEEYEEVTPNITIQEGSVGRAMKNVKKLRVKLQGSNEYSLWIPEENVSTQKLTANGNGTFEANDYGVYAFSEVTAKQKVKVVTKPDNNEYAQWDDGEEKIPSSIKVTTPPSKTSYIVAEPINTAGMVVTGYYGDGTEWGVVPSDEITIDPLVTPIGTDEEYIVDDETILYVPLAFTFPVRFNKGSFQFENGQNICTVSGGYEAAFLGITSASTVTFGAVFSRTPFTVTVRTESKGTGNVNERVYEATLASTKSGTPVYVFSSFVSGYLGGNYIYGTTSEYDGGVFNSTDPAAICYEGVKQGGTADIEAKWLREDDDKELTDTFEITISAPPSPI